MICYDKAAACSNGDASSVNLNSAVTAVNIEDLPPAKLVHHGAGTRQRRLDAEVWLDPDAREIRSGYGALCSATGRCNRGRHYLS